MKTKSMVGVIAGLSLFAAACGSDSGSSSESSAETESTTEATTAPTEPATTEPETTDASAPETTEATSDSTEPMESEFPIAIISLSPTATEMLYAIDAGSQILAVDDFSNYPPETADKMVGINAYEPNVEAIAGLEPDLVVTDGTNPDFLSQLDSLDIEHWEGSAAVTFDDVYTQIEQLGAVTGNVGEAAELVGQMQTDITAVIDGLPEIADALTYYHELDNTFFSVSSSTFIGAVYDEVGLVNIVDSADDDLGPYPQLSAEFIITSNPDLVFLACTKYCGESAESVAERPGWDAIDAVGTGNGVIEMDDDIASRWGPRIVEYLQITGEAVADVAATQEVG